MCVFRKGFQQKKGGQICEELLCTLFMTVYLIIFHIRSNVGWC